MLAVLTMRKAMYLRKVNVMSTSTLFGSSRKFGRIIGAVIALIPVAIIFVATQPAGASGQETVHGNFIERVFEGSNCPSPIHICGTGPITGNELNGTFSGLLTTENDIYQNGQLVEIIFTGTATIKVGNCTLNGSITNDEQVPSFTSTSVVTISGGTNGCANTTGVLTLSAVPDPHNMLERGTYTGTLVNFPK
jgi:hypothetical protein